MICPSCNENKWKNIDHLRLKKVGMCMCESCGMISYPSRFKSEDEIKEYYRKSYRPGPQVNALYTGERKLQYHQHFLKPVFEGWRESGLKNPVIGEVGAAYGLLLNYIRQQFPESDVHGTELTETYRRVAYHEFGLKLSEDFDTSKKYDLIVSYHVLEHQSEPDVKLKQYAGCLKDSGVFYLACPVWFKEASNGGGIGGFNIDAYFSPDHINAWAEEHLEYIIARAGLDIIHKDTKIYGNTYILKKSKKTELVRPEFDFNKYHEIVKNQYKLHHLLEENNTPLAIETYPNCTALWQQHYEYNRANFHKNITSLDDYFKKAIDACPDSSDVLLFIADVLSRYERYDEARELLNKALKWKINSPTVLMSLANCYRMKAMKEKDNKVKESLLRDSINILRFVMTISTEFLPQAINWAYKDESDLPFSL